MKKILAALMAAAALAVLSAPVANAYGRPQGCDRANYQYNGHARGVSDPGYSVGWDVSDMCVH